MIIQPSEHPGAHERHLLRKTANPLFTVNSELDDDTLLDAQRLDHEALTAFHNEFRQALETTTSLSGNVESDVILQLKSRLDQAYEMAASVGGEQEKPKDAIRKLIRHIMVAVRRGAGADVQAQMELDQEEAAREAHFALLESSLAADLLNPDSPVQPDELVPTLLSSSKDDLQLALQILDEVQLMAVLTNGAELLERLQARGVDVGKAEENLAFIQGYAEFIKDMDQG
ncbi:hypothetical protein [Thiothrix nivea]|uniref:Uncharacterized protein n=1 Tax=Thiothrix nivea (strain ATCC 35100 / DSM 5205 / JP2) TaxID=870187 RepID=A0A656HD54_THINJ|nr:hypothetical protein [Thiothrix nivea]EIJ33390.1 hypothetical protein Thini_0754 [Thiothrix nivea DSM 5205]